MTWTKEQPLSSAAAVVQVLHSMMPTLPLRSVTKQLRVPCVFFSFFGIQCQELSTPKYRMSLIVQAIDIIISFPQIFNHNGLKLEFFIALPVWKGPRLYHENAQITTDYLCISTYDICRCSQEILRGSSPWHTAEICGRTIHTVINNWRRWQVRTVRKRYLIPANLVAHCVLRYQSVLSYS